MTEEIEVLDLLQAIKLAKQEGTEEEVKEIREWMNHAFDES